MKLNREKILALSAFLQGMLTVLFCIWAATKDVRYSILPSTDEIFYGLLACLPLVALNFLLFGPLCERIRFLHGCFYLRDRVVKPIADELDYISAFCTAFAAGIGEELFFRGLIQTEFGIHVASLLFAFLHFGPAIRSYYFIALIYAVFGYYFGYLRVYTGSLWVPILAHGTYDYLALLYMRYVYVKKFSSDEDFELAHSN